MVDGLPGELSGWLQMVAHEMAARGRRPWGIPVTAGHQRRSRGPSVAPRPLQSVIDPPYHNATNGNESSGQCRAYAAGDVQSCNGEPRWVSVLAYLEGHDAQSLPQAAGYEIWGEAVQAKLAELMK